MSITGAVRSKSTEKPRPFQYRLQECVCPTRVGAHQDVVGGGVLTHPARKLVECIDEHRDAIGDGVALTNRQGTPLNV